MSVKQETDQKMMEILRILYEKDEVLGAKVISEELDKRGYSLGERAVRYHMHILDEKGFSQKVGYKGRRITDKGKEELEKGLIYEQVDFTSSYFQERIQQVSLDPERKEGCVIVNLSSFNDKEAIPLIEDVFNTGLAVSKHHRIYDNKNTKYIETICGTTIDGIFQENGIISKLLYGGLVKVENNQPIKFTQQIAYSKTSVTPIEAFTGNDNTNVLDVISSGDGIIPANIRVIPCVKKQKAINILKKLEKIDINGVLHIGEPGETILGVPIPEGLVGIPIIGGITPLCAAQEAGYDINIKLADKVAEYNQMNHLRGNIKIPLNKPTTNNADKISFVENKIFNLISKVDYDIETQKGKVIANVSYVDKEYLDESIEILKDVYHKKPEYCISNKYALLEKDDKIGIATICSLTIDGILTSNGVTSLPQFGGLLDISPNNKRFIELISYQGSSADPHEIFIKKDMHNIKGALEDSGNILANLHTIHYSARDVATDVFDKISDLSFNLFHVGKPNEYLYNARVEKYNFGYVLAGGLNPIAAIKEENIPIDVKSIETTLEHDIFDEI
ncbi:MAG: NrpR regulatory domain-containing protein [Methanosphaera sp.]|nr:NrpR regulatory domain-containing protein [Methanosphaera sp.]